MIYHKKPETPPNEKEGFQVLIIQLNLTHPKYYFASTTTVASMTFYNEQSLTLLLDVCKLNGINTSRGTSVLTRYADDRVVVCKTTGEEGFDFLGMHHRKTKAETSQGNVYFTTQQWLTKKAKEWIREVVKERLAPPSSRSRSFEEQVRMAQT